MPPVPKVSNPPTAPRRGLQWSRRAATVGAILAIYLGSVAGYFWIDSSAHTLAPGSLVAGNETVVLLDVTAIHPLDNTIEASVRVIPAKGLEDPQFGQLTTDVTVLLYPATDFGELNFPAGQVPGAVSTSMVATGNADQWPFDRYTTATISADVFTGAGETRRYVPARVEVTGSLYGWDIRSEHPGPATHSGGADATANVTFSRSRGPLALILGICLVLLALPALALFAAIEMLLGRKNFQPAFSSWFAAMLFAVVPIRNVLPGDPPPGSWIDEALVLWVLLALVGAMVIYVIAWTRRSD